MNIFLFNYTTTPEIYPYFHTLSLHAALPISNHETVWRSDALTVYEEGCLSLPEQYAEVERPDKIRFRYLDEKGVPQEREAEGLLATRSEEHTSELQSLMRISYAVFCLKKKKRNRPIKNKNKTNNRTQL